MQDCHVCVQKIVHGTKLKEAHSLLLRVRNNVNSIKDVQDLDKAISYVYETAKATGGI